MDQVQPYKTRRDKQMKVQAYTIENCFETRAACWGSFRLRLFPGRVARHECPIRTNQISLEQNGDED